MRPLLRHCRPCRLTKQMSSNCHGIVVTAETAAVGINSGLAAGAFGAVAAAGGIDVAFAPASNPAIPVGLFAVFGLGRGVVSTLMWALEADTVEYGEWRSGVRAPARLPSVSTRFL